MNTIYKNAKGLVAAFPCSRALEPWFEGVEPPRLEKTWAGEYRCWIPKTDATDFRVAGAAARVVIRAAGKYCYHFFLFLYVELCWISNRREQIRMCHFKQIRSHVPTISNARINEWMHEWNRQKYISATRQRFGALTNYGTLATSVAGLRKASRMDLRKVSTSQKAPRLIARILTNT